jgi:hypothetical protein
MSDKNKILDEVKPVLDTDNGLDVKLLLQMLLFVVLVLMFTFPKIYLQHEIYYKSRQIAKMQYEYKNLSAQSRLIKTKIEAMHFDNKIANTMF